MQSKTAKIYSSPEGEFLFLMPLFVVRLDFYLQPNRKIQLTIH